MGLLKKAIKTKTDLNKFDSILINGHSITDKAAMANEFSNFFTSAVTRISEIVNPTSLDPGVFHSNLVHLN
jgi:hypothetical protein